MVRTGGVGLLQEQEVGAVADTNKNDGVEINEYRRRCWRIRWHDFFMSFMSPLEKRQQQAAEVLQHQKDGVRKIEPKSFYIAMGKGGIYQKWFGRGYRANDQVDVSEWR